MPLYAIQLSSCTKTPLTADKCSQLPQHCLHQLESSKKGRRPLWLTPIYCHHCTVIEWWCYNIWKFLLSSERMLKSGISREGQSTGQWGNSATHTCILPAYLHQQQQSFYGPLSGATRVSWYQKKHSPTHHHDHHPIYLADSATVMSTA